MLKFIVAPSRSQAHFQVAPSRSRAQVHCCAVEVASSIIVTPSRSQAHFQVTPSRSHAQFIVAPSSPLPCHNLFSGPANPIDAPQSFPRAGEFHRHATIFSAGRRISLPCCNLFSGPANPIVSAGQRIPLLSRQNLISAGTSSSCLLYHNSI